MSDPGCPFCQRIDAGDYDDRNEVAVSFPPLHPVTAGHRLVVPVKHYPDALASPRVTGQVFEFAARVAMRYDLKVLNMITSVGAAATQSVRHLHVHLVPRAGGDGLALPWTGQDPGGTMGDL